MSGLGQHPARDDRGLVRGPEPSVADIRAFSQHDREPPEHRPVPIRARHWHEVYEAFPADAVRAQAARWVDSGTPFCPEGTSTPLGNPVPECYDRSYGDNRAAVSERPSATNNFPGRARSVVPERRRR